jgi:hypothetical protein
MTRGYRFHPVPNLREILAGTFRRNFRSYTEREQIRQAVLRWARERGLPVRTVTFGGTQGYLRAVVEVVGRCPSVSPRRAQAIEGARRNDEAQDLIAVQQMLRIIRTELAQADVEEMSA